MSDTLHLYVYGCTSCGSNGALIRTVQRKSAGEVVLHDSKYNKADGQKHLQYLKDNGLSTASYIPLVVYQEKVYTLKQWVANI